MPKVEIYFRAFSTLITAVIAVIVSARLGDTTAGKIWAAVFIAAVIAIAELFLNWIPKHSVAARKLLDARSNMVGVWLQTVKQGSEYNRFSIFWVEPAAESEYTVSGVAYDSNGHEYAYWSSLRERDSSAVVISPDGKSMIYIWEGTVIGDQGINDSTKRTGFANIDLRAHGGQVQHVGMGLDLEVRFQRITQEWLNKEGFKRYSPDDLKAENEDARNEVARSYAKEAPVHP